MIMKMNNKVRSRNDLNRRWSHLGFKAGFNQGFNKGFDDGLLMGREAGIRTYGAYFEGTSIIIPHYNKKEFLAECIESILAYTNEPFEIIVIDNGSSDGSLEYLQSMRGHLRYKANQENKGFAEGVNQGLMMAKGTMILILNNDTVVTTDWLSNLLVCVHSDEKIGIAGPITNYISGEQFIATDYDSISGMHEFARTNNCSNPGSWMKTDRMTGFCMMMRRDVFHRLGYFDEGFEIGNCEDDDYGLRARLLGLELIIAKDTFIHHYGSVSMKALNTQFDQVYEKNLAYYSNKWGDPHSLAANIEYSLEATAPCMVDFYPTCVAVKGPGHVGYWIEGGFRHPLESTSDIPTTRISQLDCLNWPLGNEISSQHCRERMAQLSLETTPVQEGRLVKTPDGQLYQYKDGKLCKIATHLALQCWHLDDVHTLEIERVVKHEYPEGYPIIAPTQIRAANL